MNKVFEECATDIEAIFGADLAFDLEGLLVERLGSNIRNDVSHGLLDETSFSSAIMLYLWWLTLHLCYRFLIAQQQQAILPNTKQADDQGKVNEDHPEVDPGSC